MNMPSKLKCEIIASLGDDLAYIKETVSSLLERCGSQQYRITFLGVKSDQAVVEYISSVADANSTIDFLFVEDMLVDSINSILHTFKSEYTCFVSSNAIFPDQWLESLVSALESRDDAFAALPMSNGGGSTSVPLPPGSTINTIDWFFKSRTGRVAPDLYLDTSACVLFDNSVFSQARLLDTNYQTLKWALLDIAISGSGLAPRVCLAEDSFVYQFPDQQTEEFERDRQYFCSKPGARRQLKNLQRHNRKAMLAILTDLAADSRWSPLTTARETYRKIRNHYHHGEHLPMVRAAFRGLMQLPWASTPVVSKRFTSSMVQPGRLRVTYVLHNLTVAGGVISTIQLANELVLLGAEVRVVALYQYPETEDWKWYTQPIIYRNPEELIRNFPESDVVIATHWTTANWVAEIVRQGSARQSVYFLQDYESWFFPESDEKSRSEVKRSYALIGNKIVKSDWLQNLVQRDGYPSQKILLGLDLGVFYPRDLQDRDGITVVAMARPGTPRRGFGNLIRALGLIKAEFPSTTIVLFGEDLSNQTIDFDYECVGVVSSPDDMAELYSIATVFIDASDFQGFGRTALEAMACDTACILTNVGGLSEYAKHDDNCLLVPPADPQSILEAFRSLVSDEELMSRVRKNGLEIAQRFSHKIEARNTLSYLESIT